MHGRLFTLDLELDRDRPHRPVPELLRAAARGVRVRDPDRRAVGAPRRAKPGRGRRPRARHAARGCRRRAAPARLRRRLLLGLRAPLHRPVQGRVEDHSGSVPEPRLRRRLGHGARASAAPRSATASPGRSSTPEGSRTTAVSSTASVAAWYLLRSDKFPFWKAADMAGMVIPVGLGFGRMGCLLAGCCFGTRTDGPMAPAFPWVFSGERGSVQGWALARPEPRVARCAALAGLRIGRVARPGCRC